MFSQEEENFKREVTWLLKEKYQGKETPEFQKDLARLQNGEPLPYLIGHQPFLNCQIYLDSKPLIPRVETEYWTDFLIKSWRGSLSPKILELCAGSGAIGIALLKNLPGSTVTFTELDPDHLTTIVKNAEVNNLGPERYQVYVSDLFSKVPKEKSFDLIVANPPYIDKSLGRTEASVKEHEPALALYATEEGFALLRKIISAAPFYLKPGGELWLEHEPEHTTQIYECANLNFSVTTHKDQYGVERFSQLVLK